MRHLLPLFAIMLCIVPASHTAAREPQLIPVTVCGQIIPDHATGYLTDDLDCTGYAGTAPHLLTAGAAVNLGRKSKLDLRGFTLTGGVHGVLGDNVRCGRAGLPFLHDCSPGPHEVYRGTIVGTPESTGSGIGADRLIVHDVVVTGFSTGIWGYIQLTLSDSRVSGASFDGANGGRTKIYRSTITDNLIYGVSANNWVNARLWLVDSVVTGNGTDPVCDTNPLATCSDVLSRRFPILVDTTCNTSAIPGTGKEDLNWGVCALD